MYAAQVKCKTCGRGAAFEDAKPEFVAKSSLPPDDEDEASCDMWVCGVCGTENIVLTLVAKEA